MTVKELIEKLQYEDPEKIIVVSGYEGGYDEIGDISPIQLKLNVNSDEIWYYGKHEESSVGECHAIRIC